MNHRYKGYDNHGLDPDYSGKHNPYTEYNFTREIPLYQGHQNFQDSLTNSI